MCDFLDIEKSKLISSLISQAGWLSSFEVELKAFLDRNYVTLKDDGALPRFINVVVMLDKLDIDSPEVIAFDIKQWGRFENRYYVYFISCQDILV